MKRMRKKGAAIVCAILAAFSAGALASCAKENDKGGNVTPAAKTEKIYTDEQTYADFTADISSSFTVAGNSNISDGKCVLSVGASLKTAKKRRKSLAYFSLSAESGFSYEACGARIDFTPEGIFCKNGNVAVIGDFSGVQSGKKLLIRVETYKNEISIGVRPESEPLEKLYEDAAKITLEGGLKEDYITIAAVNGAVTLYFIRISSLEATIDNQTDDYNPEDEPNLYDKKPSVSEPKSKDGGAE